MKTSNKEIGYHYQTHRDKKTSGEGFKNPRYTNITTRYTKNTSLQDNNYTV